MTQTTLAVVTVLIDNEIIAHKPNSVMVTLGVGERTVRTQVSGPNSVESIIAENAETRIGKFQLDLENTPRNIINIERIKSKGTVDAVIYGPGVTINYDGVALLNDPELSLSEDGDHTLEFGGAQGVAS